MTTDDRKRDLIEQGRQILVSVYGHRVRDERAIVRAILAQFEAAQKPAQRSGDLDAADTAFKARDEHATWDDPADRDAAVRWHWRGFQDGAEFARRPVSPGKPGYELVQLDQDENGNPIYGYVEITDREDGR